MVRFMKYKHFLKDASGATAIEYALIATLISVAVIIGVSQVGNNLNRTMNGTENSVTSALK